jgi:hypothetical protein
MKNPDLSDFFHAAGFYLLSIFLAFLAELCHQWAALPTSFGAIFVICYAFLFLALLSFGAFVLGSISVYAGVLSLKGGNK